MAGETGSAYLRDGNAPCPEPRKFPSCCDFAAEFENEIAAKTKNNRAFIFSSSGRYCPNRQQCQFRSRAFYFEPRDGIFSMAAQSVAVHRQNPISRNCCWARCACRMSRTVFLSAHPCFHGLHRPHADDLRALILRCVSFVFTGCCAP